MDRPASIVTFERLYLGALAIGVINTVMSWSTNQAQMAAQTAQVPEAGQIISWLVPVATAIGVGISLLLWYFIARRGAAVAKWIATILVVAAVGFMALALSGVPIGQVSTAFSVSSAPCFRRCRSGSCSGRTPKSGSAR